MRVTFVVIAIALFGLSGVCLARQVRQVRYVELVQGVQTEQSAYELGAKILFEYALRNDSDQPITFSFPSAQQFDLWVTRGGEELFRLSRNKFYAQMMTSITLKPGETKIYGGEWDQKDTSGKQIGPGTYTVYAQLTPSGKPPPPTSARVPVGATGPTLIPINIKEGISNFTALVGKRVLISAVYKGSSPDSNDPNTKDGPPITRSDWAVCDQTGCMYVTGYIALDPVKDKDVNITVIGKLEKTSKGQVYMILDSVAIEKKASRFRAS